MEPRAYRSGAAGTPPALPASAVTGYPKDADEASGATVPGPHWFYMVGEEVRNLQIRGGQAPAIGAQTQMLAAIKSIAGS
ncbi:MAG TPA: hypothetical protein VF453_06505 [Burkholderiaceae bacterium]